MPRQGRLDIPGLLQHVIVRGIERVCKARDLFCFLAVRQLGYSGVATGEMLGLKRAAVSQAVRRGELGGEKVVDELFIKMDNYTMSPYTPDLYSEFCVIPFVDWILTK